MLPHPGNEQRAKRRGPGHRERGSCSSTCQVTGTDGQIQIQLAGRRQAGTGSACSRVGEDASVDDVNDELTRGPTPPPPSPPPPGGRHLAAGEGCRSVYCAACVCICRCVHSYTIMRSHGSSKARGHELILFLPKTPVGEQRCEKPRQLGNTVTLAGATEGRVAILRWLEVGFKKD